MWLARNPDGKNKFGTLCLFKNKPVREEKSWIPSEYEEHFPMGVFSYICGIDEEFPNLKWEDEPVEVKLHEIEPFNKTVCKKCGKEVQYKSAVIKTDHNFQPGSGYCEETEYIECPHCGAYIEFFQL